MSINFLNFYCPSCKTFKLIPRKDNFQCSNFRCYHFKTKNFFKKKDKTPVLISEKLCDTAFKSSNINSYVKRPIAFLYNIKAILFSKNKITKKNSNLFIKLIKKKKKPKVLIIGSGEKGKGSDNIWNEKKILRIGIDVYKSPTVDVICDAHYLPFKKNEYDGVWIQAVLEHVIDPKKVVDEIFRVLKRDGVVYAETPFMQQVHEGAHDFTRFTVTGHRYLFKKFSQITIGGLGGTEIVLAWSIKYFFWSILRNRKLSSLISFIFELFFRPFSLLTSKKSLYDASSGVFFMGRKKINYKLSHKELIKLYKGQIL